MHNFCSRLSIQVKQNFNCYNQVLGAKIVRFLLGQAVANRMYALLYSRRTCPPLGFGQIILDSLNRASFI